MSSHVIPPASLDQLQHDLETPSRNVTVVIGQEGDKAWRSARVSVGAMPRSEAYLLTRSSDASEWTDDPNASGWPAGSAWEGGTPTTICFGVGTIPRLYLNRAQAEDNVIVTAAHAKALELSRG